MKFNSSFPWLGIAVLALTTLPSAIAQMEPPPVVPRIGPVELAPGMRPPFATEVAPRKGATGFGPLGFQPLPGLPYDTAFACSGWFSQGPGLTTNGDLNISSQSHPTSGCVSAIVPHPTNASILYIGTVNGGVWRTDNALSNNVSWRPLTDDQLSLSFGGLALDPTDASGQTLVAGIGRRSSYGGAGGAQIGLFRTTDGGTTWTQLGATALAGRSIYNIHARGALIIMAVVSTDNGTQPGLYRTTDGGATFTNMSGFAGSGLPAGAVTHLAADPGNNARFYAHVASTGVYRTDNSGATWVNVSTGLAIANVGQLALTVYDHGGTDAVYAAELTSTSRVYRATSQGTNWTQMDSVQANTGGSFNGFTADPLDPNLVYLSGLFVRANFPYSGRVVRGDASQPAGSQWTSIASTNGTGNGTAPHTDSRALVFDSLNQLIEGDDGGIYELPVANTGNNGTTSLWRSLNGDLQDSEMHSMAYDRLSKIFIGGAQDTGFQEQTATATGLWNKTSNGDGGDAAVDVVTLPSQSIRYGSSQNLGGFYRSTNSANNVRVGLAFPALTPLGGAPAVSSQFVTPIALNAVNPARILFGAANGVYESTNRGDTVSRLNTSVANSPAKMAYGGRIGTTTNADVIYVGVGASIQSRTNAGGALAPTPAAFPGNTVRGVTMNPNDWRSAYVVGVTSAYNTPDAGATWVNLTGNLTGVGTLRSVEYLTLPGGDAIVVGADLGAFIMRTASPGVWKTLGTNLPFAPVYETRYDPVGNVLAVSTLGRGAWLYDFNPVVSRYVTTLADSGRGSLRQTILDVNADNCPSLITFTVTGVIPVLSDLPVITANTVTITGPGTNLLTLNGGNVARLFGFAGGTTNHVSGITLANGFSVNHGGAIQNSGRTIIENSVLISNSVVNSYGGAACNFPGGTILATNCLFTGNSIRGGNGDSIGAGNGGPGGGGAGMGGAIYTEGTALTLSGCKFFNNAAYGGNGGNGDHNGFGNDPGGNGGYPNGGLGGAAGQPGGAGGFGGGGGGGAGSFSAGFAGGNGGFGGGGGAGGARGGGGNGGAAGAGGLYGGGAGASFASHSGGGGGGAGLGGAVFTRTGAVTIVSCTFTGNSATNGVGGGGSFGGGNGANGQGSGGAVFNIDAKIIAAGNVFTNNSASTGEPDADVSTLVTTLVDSGPGSLRQAICNAAVRPGLDIVTFAANLNGSVLTPASELVVSDDTGPVVITATNLPGGLAINGQGARRAFNIASGSVILDSLTLSNCMAVSDNGGAITCGGNLTLRRCTLNDNGASYVGGVYNYSTTATLILDHCTLFNNSASNFDGGLYSYGPLEIHNSTIVSNRCGTAAAGGGARGAATVLVQNSVLAENLSGPPGSSQPDDLGAPSYSLVSYSLIGGHGTLASGVNGNIVGTLASPIDPLLGTLADNGGPTLTLYPLPGSPVINAGDPALNGVGLADQRGQPRVWLGRVDMGAVEFVPAGNSVAFDGVSNYLILSNAAASLPTNEITVEFWARVDTVRDQFAFVLYPDMTNDRLAFSPTRANLTTYWDFGDLFNGGRVQYPTPAGTIGVWTHWALVSTHAGNAMRVYRNGNLEASTSTNRIFTQYSGSLVLGARLDSPQEFLQGQMDEFRIWSVARTQSEIQAAMHTGVCSPQTNLWVYWKFDEASGTTVFDYSGNGRHATLVNSASRTLSFAPLAAPGSLTLIPISGTQARLTWVPNSGCLQSAPDVTGPWTAVPGATNGQVIVTTPANQFFRTAQ
jgi:hypothetical protein